MYTNQQFSDVLQQVQQKPTYTAEDVRTAKEKWLQAQVTLLQAETAYKAPVYRRKETAMDLLAQFNQAKAEEAQTRDTFNEIFQKAGWLVAQERKQIRLAEQERIAKEEQERRAAAVEAEAKRQFRDSWLTNGGSETQFESSWPSLWARELEKRVVEGRNDLVDAMKQSGRYNI